MQQQGIQGLFEPMGAEQGIPHHGRKAQAGGHGSARAPAFHVDPELQAAQSPLLGGRKLAEIVLDQGKTPGFEGLRIGLGERRPLVEIECETEIVRWLHREPPVRLPGPILQWVSRQLKARAEWALIISELRQRQVIGADSVFHGRNEASTAVRRAVRRWFDVPKSANRNIIRS